MTETPEPASRKPTGVPAFMTNRTDAIAAKIEAFIRAEVIPYEKDPRTGPHGPSDELVQELRDKARKAGVLTPHILPDGSHLTQRETAIALIKTGLSPLGPLACNTMAPDEGNMYLLGKVGSPEQKARFLEPLVSGRARSAFFMTEPAEAGGAGSDPSMMQTTCRLDGNHWVINGRKKFITGAEGAALPGVAGSRRRRSPKAPAAGAPDTGAPAAGAPRRPPLAPKARRSRAAIETWFRHGSLLQFEQRFGSPNERKPRDIVSRLPPTARSRHNYV